MSFRVLPILSSLLVLSSCSTHRIFRPVGCDGKGVWSKKVKNPDFSIKKDVFFYGYKNQQKFKTLLGDDVIVCEQVKSMSLSIKKSWKDALVSLIPFVSSYQLTLSGTLQSTAKRIIRDDISNSRDGDEDSTHDE